MERQMTKEKSTPAPLETTPGKQQDDNIDDLGRKKDGTTLDQPHGDTGRPGTTSTPKPK
jgi:hypothetical protein